VLSIKRKEYNHLISESAISHNNPKSITLKEDNLCVVMRVQFLSYECII
jgi:hypothetical protein